MSVCLSTMYALKIEIKSQNKGDCTATSSSAEHDVPANVLDAVCCSHRDVDEIQVSVGNPRVEHLTGIVHLYRQTRGRDEAGTSSSDLPVPAHATCLQ